MQNKYPRVIDLINKATKRIPFFISEYLFSGTGNDKVAVANNNIFEDVFLIPKYLKGAVEVETEQTILGSKYGAPFGVAPIGSGGSIWPGAEIALAKMCTKKKIPYCLSSVASLSLEEISPHLEGNGWFQLYPPKDKVIRDDILKRASDAGFSVLVVTVDIPATSRRERVKKAGVTIPPKLNLKTFFQALLRPLWSIGTLLQGMPSFGTMTKYNFLSQDELTKNWNEMPRYIDWEYLSEIRSLWKGQIILKGILDEENAIKASKVVDAIYLSNHGGRQIDLVPSPLQLLPNIRKKLGKDFPIIIDSGYLSGQDIAKALVLGADFVMLGRAFMIGVSALGKKGAEHVHYILHDELSNIMEQMCCKNILELKQENATVKDDFFLHVIEK
ncbi:alpha-hydroxy-acid oxidizing protein [Gammaproteobacteria bacterium]|jgi:L-lactate dehydrogenase (cytochrome)|nr:alpha-hydroxy-acid oxidizing protein [Gammaproteobacteria bacterium]MDB4194715.1 alpha-hydroxy-acid oxidizing protein [Gammaproteobacteria bacterium]MDC0387280.1 alpha-hydroxy-acid oxidizing protein [Gammaproteobacteria bacterium]